MSHFPATGQADAERAESRSDDPPRRREWNRFAGWICGLVTFISLCLATWPDCLPPLPSGVTFEVTFPRGTAGQGEPLIVTGVGGDGDCLAVQYIDERTAILIYDVWGVGGPRSEPFSLLPGTPRTLEIELPALAPVPHVKPRETRPLRVALDGRELLRADAYFHRRAPREIYFGTNPLGGTIAGPTFGGTLALPDGRVVRGGPESFFTWRQRAPWLIRGRIDRLALDLLASIAVGLAVAQLVRWRLRPPRPREFAVRTRPPHGWFAGTAAVCTLAFIAMITGGSFRLIFPESFGNFYDYQAQSLLQGRLDVEEAALSGEAFVFQGKVYGYFGPTPAVLRLPFTVFDLAFGQLSRSYMVAYFVACLVAVYFLLIHITRLATGRPTWPSRFNVVVLTLLTGLGSTLFFLGSRAYIYHEAILCGAAFSLWATYFALRYFATPTRKGWLAALACGVAAVHARPPIGLFALSMLGCAALALAFRALIARADPHAHHASSARLPPVIRSLGVAVLAGLGVLSFNALSYLKFRSFSGAPLEYHVQYHPERIANIEGRNFHASNFRYVAGSYVWRPAFVLRVNFPYFFIEGTDPARFPNARIDLPEPVAAMPYTMPAICFLAAIGGAFALWCWPAARWPLGLIAGALLPMAAALFTAVAVSQRYTADFCAALLGAAAFGLVGFERLPPRGYHVIRVVIAILTTLSILITIAITLHYQGEGVWGVPQEVTEHYRALCTQVDTFFGVRRQSQ